MVTARRVPCLPLAARGWAARRLAALAAFAALAVACLSCQAASPLMIWPVDPVIAGPQRAVALWLENRGENTVSMQVRVFRWSQVEGEDRFEPQGQVVASPPISQIPPGQRQMVRLIATTPTPPQQEHAYRVLVDELPAPAPSAEAGSAEPVAAVQLQIRYAIPLFVYGPLTLPARLADARSLVDGTTVVQPELWWTVQRDQGKERVRLINRGAAHARLTSAGWTGAAGAAEAARQDTLSYVLPYSEKWLDIAPRPGAGTATLNATVNGRDARLPRAEQ